jgi:photosystem II stability/assembly factor-like uncharacterized protein
MKQTLHLLFLLVPFVLQAQDLWTPTTVIPSNSEYYLPTMDVADENTIWITSVSESNAQRTHHWHLSTDGGYNWATGIIPFGSTGLGISNIEAVSATTAYIAVYSPMATEAGAIWKTEDAGATWSKIPGLFETVGSSFPNLVHFFDADHGLCAGDPQSGYFEIYTTSDAGVNWTRLASANIPLPLGIEFGQLGEFIAKGNSIWFHTTMGRIFRSNDMGMHWQATQLPVDFGGTTGFDYAFSNLSNGIVASSDYDFYRTDDAGASFVPYYPPSGTNLAVRSSKIWNIPGTTSFISRGLDLDTYEQGSSFSDDDGMTWYDLNRIDPNPIVPLQAWFKDEDFAYCLGVYTTQVGMPQEYLFFRHGSNNLGFRAALGSKSFASEKFTVSPNPAADVVKISGADIHAISICDVSGKTVLVQNCNGASEISVDISALQNGIYFSKITDASGKTQAIKLIKN